MAEPGVVSSAFDFATAGQIRFGVGRAAELPGIVQQLGGRPFVCTGANPARCHDLLAQLPSGHTTFSVRGEPTVDMVAEAVGRARAAGADVVVGLGGGSVLDLGKAVAALLANGGEPLDYLEVVGRGRPLTQPSMPYVAVPTTAGTGAEVTANAVLSAPAHGIKASLRGATLLPRVALVDPALTLGCPPAVTASSGLDALTQCLEPFVSPFATPITDGFAREGIRRAVRSLPRAYQDGADLDARTDMSLSALLGGLALANAKLGAVHALAGVLGGRGDAAHGVLCAVLLAPVAEANVQALRAREPHNPALERYEEAARLLTGRADARVEEGVEALRRLVARLGVPPLALPDDVDAVVAGAQRASSMRGNPIALTGQQLSGVLAAAA